MARLILRCCHQVGMEQWDNDYKTIDIHGDFIDSEIKAGWCVIGAELAPLKEEADNSASHNSNSTPYQCPGCGSDNWEPKCKVCGYFRHSC